MSLGAGVRLGPYEVLASLGAGGMGEVYRARDTKLGRDVALKVIPDTFALDPDRLARFQREAQVLASLNHPHIAAIYGFEDSGETHALVLELVEGETLEDRIARGAIPLDEALPVARQICEALEAAHEQGIVHRDLKPANIKITLGGVVKVLDFGLAKLTETATGGTGAAGGWAALSMSPTITSPAMMTGVGVILGTAAYMSPEQAKGRPADKRSDIWAFGCVLFEMLTGKRPFEGEDVTDVMVAVLSREPAWTTLPANVPAPVRTLLRRCLEKDRRKRVADISTALFAFDEHASLGGSPTVLRRRPLWRQVAALTAGALVVAAVATTLTWIATRPAGTVPPGVSRLELPTSGPAALSINGTDPDLVITPDGSRVVYVGNGGTQIFVRALDALEAAAVFAGQPRGPFISPDGQWIGFVEGGALKKVAMTGGPAVTLGTLGNGPRGATWGADDTIIFATSDAPTGLQRVAAAGGPTTVLTRPDRAQGEADHLWPELLPGGHAVLFTITAVKGGLDAAQVAVMDLQTGTRKIVVRGGSQAHYVPSGLGLPARTEGEGGHLVYATAGTLRAVPFDLGALQTRGTSVPVVPDVVTTDVGGVDAVVARNGTLAYVLGSVAADLQRMLVWVDRQGRETSVPAPPRQYVYPRLSPDGSRVALDIRDQERDIWIWDFDRTTLTRVTFDPGLDADPVWTPDGRRLIFSSERAGAPSLFWQAADGTGAIDRLTESGYRRATAVSPDGRRLIFTAAVAKTGDDVMQVELDGMHRVTPLVQSTFSERNGIVSPDGRWLAYEANDSGRNEIYVRPYPDVNSGRWQVSTGGGAQPLWARSGQELFYAAPRGALMRVGVEGVPSWASTTATQVIKEGYYTNDVRGVGRSYGVSPDGQRFLMIKNGGGTDQTAAPPQLIVVQHWTEELKRLVPTK